MCSSDLIGQLDQALCRSLGILLLCSDGLTRDVKPAEILTTVRQEKDPQAAAERLVELANAAGGLDNTTVILVSIQHAASETPMQRVWHWLVS